MRKTIVSIASAMLILASAVSFAGCGSSESSASEQTATAAAQQATDSASQAAAGGIDASDAVFTYNGVSVELNGDADAIVSALGEAQDVSSQLSCHGEGEDKTYKYEGFTVNTYPLDGQDRILEVVISSEGIATSKGIQVGDSASKVVSTYGDGYKEIGLYYAYDAGDGKSLQFFIENDAVKEIDYYYDV